VTIETKEGRKSRKISFFPWEIIMLAYGSGGKATVCEARQHPLKKKVLVNQMKRIE